MNLSEQESVALVLELPEHPTISQYAIAVLRLEQGKLYAWPEEANRWDIPVSVPDKEESNGK